MDQSQFSYFATQGVFCILFVLLGIWAKSFINRVMQENKERENGYIANIGKLSDLIKTELVEIKTKISK